MISVENVGKRYTLRHKSTSERYATFRDVITRRAMAPFRALSGKRQGGGSPREHHGRLWAVKGVSFEILEEM